MDALAKRAESLNPCVSPSHAEVAGVSHCEVEDMILLICG